MSSVHACYYQSLESQSGVFKEGACDWVGIAIIIIIPTHKGKHVYGKDPAVFLWEVSFNSTLDILVIILL